MNILFRVSTEDLYFEVDAEDGEEAEEMIGNMIQEAVERTTGVIQGESVLHSVFSAEEIPGSDVEDEEEKDIDG